MSQLYRKLINFALSLPMVLSAGAVFANPSVYPTGTTIYDPAKAWNSYVVFADPNGKTHLIDMAGNEVHHWEKAGFSTTAALANWIGRAMSSGAGMAKTRRAHARTMIGRACPMAIR